MEELVTVVNGVRIVEENGVYRLKDKGEYNTTPQGRVIETSSLDMAKNIAREWIWYRISKSNVSGVLTYQFLLQDEFLSGDKREVLDHINTLGPRNEKIQNWLNGCGIHQLKAVIACLRNGFTWQDAYDMSRAQSELDFMGTSVDRWYEFVCFKHYYALG